MHRGDVYNGDAVEKTVEDVTVEITKHGYPFYLAEAALGNQYNCISAAPLVGGGQLNVASLPVREESANGGYLTSMAG